MIIKINFEGSSPNFEEVEQLFAEFIGWA